MQPRNGSAPAGGTARGALQTNGDGMRLHCTAVSAEPLLARLEGVQKYGNGWRARCPACGGRSRKLSVALTDTRVLIHCFDCADAQAVLDAVGLRWADLMPPRTWPESPEELRRARRALREAGWSAALKVLALESTIVRIAANQLTRWQTLSHDDDQRLALAHKRITDAATVLTEADAWRPRRGP